MKRFLFKISFYIIGIILLFAVLGFYADGNTDDNYMHFAAEKPRNIILGDSRGAQAIVPEILEKKLSRKFDNFSLNVVQSPYGPIYLNALKKKINPDTGNGVFILTVNPWNLSLHVDAKTPKDYPEEHSPLKNMHFYNWSPNYEYLLKNYHRSWFKLFSEREEVGRSNTYLHRDGWMEVTIDMQKDSISKREQDKIKFYSDKKTSGKQELSEMRLSALCDIIEYLTKRGDVYLVRIPTGKEIYEIEKNKFPGFTGIMNDMSRQYKVPYFDFSHKSTDYIYTDGNHMYKESGKKLSSQIADSIALKKH